MSRGNGLPATWTRAPLGELGKWYGGGTPSKAVEAFWKDGEVPWFSPKDMKSFRLHSSEDRITRAAVERGNVDLFEAGTVLMVVRSGILAHTFPVSIAAVEGTMNQDLKGLVPRHGIHSSYVAFALRNLGRDILHSCAKEGTTVHSIETAALHRFEIPIAPTKEQRRIVRKLDELLSGLDAGVTALERARANLKRYRAAVLKAAVQGRLTEKWRIAHPNIEPASKLLQRILAERRKRWEGTQLKKYADKGQTPPKEWKARYPEPLEPSRALAALPRGWCWATLDQLAEIGTGATPLRTEQRYWRGGSIPWVTSAAVNEPFVREPSELVTPAALAETNLFVYPRYTLILAMYGEGRTRGKVSELLIEASTNQALAALVFVGESSRCRPHVKMFLAKSYEDMRRIAAGGVQPNLNLGLIKEMTVPVPPLAEQAEIAAAVEHLLSVQEQLVDQGEKSVTRSTRLRQAILKRAFEGKLVPQDPKDEPASKLLARIRAARTGEGRAKGRARRGKGAVSR